ncbi:3-hydroxyacyl-[acyl-carrier-protein] dehydratase FabZ [bacterium (Candidatus Howlettbacteria) CG_4_10_14_0_8_um_filter_40_9]|nr:MAG: 3-hydroxyacyl-[acyl-carrier-protein] dehydratase FabZ [bacterium (Candidatus Howlettbacteria) CG_4_10_14_0_8_um_filter_40_9]
MSEHRFSNKNCEIVLPLGQEGIEKIIPHRFPFLFIDRVYELEIGKKAVGSWAIKGDEWFFQGHFPEYPVVPGVLIAEALAQMGAVAILSKAENRGQIALFAGIDSFRFKKEVLPGDVLVLTTELTKVRGSVGKSEAVATVNDKLVASGTLTFAIKA